MFTGPAGQRCWTPASGQRSWGPRPQGDPVQEQGAKGPGIRSNTLLPILLWGNLTKVGLKSKPWLAENREG